MTEITTHRFYKDEFGWFIDLPEFIEMGLGSKGNLAMVAGADLMLDELSKDGNEVTLRIYDKPFEGHEDVLVMQRMGMDEDVLNEYGHPIQFGGYYNRERDNFEIWLCPVTIYVFGGEYPDRIYYQVVK